MRIRYIALFTVLLCALTIVKTASSVETSDDPIKTSFVIVFKPGTSDADIKRVITLFGSGQPTVRGDKSSNWYTVKINNGMSPNNAVYKAQKDPVVLWAAPFGKSPTEGVYLEAHKVLVVRKDGTKVSGFVFWGDRCGGQFPFETKKFLNYFLHPPEGCGGGSFELYPTFTPINDGGNFGGFAESEEDKLDIQADTVAELQSMPDKLEGTRLGGFSFFKKEQIKVMQGRFRFMEDISDGEKTYTAVNYDPRVSKKKLHQLLQDFRRKVDKDATNWQMNSVAKPWKVVLMFIDMTDD